MKFNIYRASIIYGGGPSPLNFILVQEKVSEDFVKGYFANMELDEKLRTKEDQMGCYSEYKITVVSLD